MNTTFNITPTGIPNNTLHLLIEVGDYGISFIWFTKNPLSVKGIAIYNFTSADHTADIKNVLSMQEQFLSRLASVTICYDFKESLLIPGKYNHTSVTQEALSLVYGNDKTASMNNDLVTSVHIYNHYRIPKEVEMLFSKQFLKADIFHSTSLQMEQLNHSRDLLYCIIFHNSVKTFLYKGGTLQIVQQFNYTSPGDVAYFLLNICEQHSIKPADFQLRLSGMIDEQSKLYMELYQYFSRIDFDKAAPDIFVPDEIKNLPAHFLSHLTALASCVS